MVFVTQCQAVLLQHDQIVLHAEVFNFSMLHEENTVEVGLLEPPFGSG